MFGGTCPCRSARARPAWSRERPTSTTTIRFRPDTFFCAVSLELNPPEGSTLCGGDPGEPGYAGPGAGNGNNVGSAFGVKARVEQRNTRFRPFLSPWPHRGPAQCGSRGRSHRGLRVPGTVLSCQAPLRSGAGVHPAAQSGDGRRRTPQALAQGASDRDTESARIPRQHRPRQRDAIERERLHPEPDGRDRAGQGPVLGHAGGQRRRPVLRHVPLQRHRHRHPDQEPDQPEPPGRRHYLPAHAAQ